MQTSVIAVPLTLEVSLFADSTSTYKFHELNTPLLRELLPHAASLQLHWLLDDVASNEIDWNIDAYVGWDREHELAAVPFFVSGGNPADQTASGPGLAAVTNLLASSHYMRHARLLLKWRLHAGVTVPKQGTWSAILYVTLKA